MYDTKGEHQSVKPVKEAEIICGELPRILFTRLPRKQARPTYVPKVPDRLCEDVVNGKIR